MITQSNKMKTKMFIFLFLGIATLSSCTKVDNWAPPFPFRAEESYIQYYRKVDTLIAKVDNGIYINSDREISLSPKEGKESLSINDGIFINVRGEWKATLVTAINSLQFGYSEAGIQGEAFQKYRKITDDTHYNAMPAIGLLKAPVAISEVLKSFNITCNKAFGKQYPSGTNLNKLFSIYFENPYLVVKNNYQQPTNGYKLNNVHYDYFPHIMTGGKLNEISFTDLPFIGNIYMCVLNEAPEQTDEYVFTIEIIKTNGEKVMAQTKPVKIMGSIK